MLKQPKEKELDTTSELNSVGGENISQEEKDKSIYTVQGDSKKETEKINEYIPSMETEQIEEVLSKELSDEQKETIDKAFKENEIELKNQEFGEIVYSDNSIASVQQAICYNLSTLFNEFIVDAQLGKYEYEKIGPMLATYANDLEQDIKNSNQFSDEELKILSAEIAKHLVYLNNALYPYLGSSAVKSEEDLISQGIIEEDEGEHPYQEIIDGTIDEAQKLEQEKREEILEDGVVIPDGATEYTPPKFEVHVYDENGNEIENPEAQ